MDIPDTSVAYDIYKTASSIENPSVNKSGRLVAEAEINKQLPSLCTDSSEQPEAIFSREVAEKKQSYASSHPVLLDKLHHFVLPEDKIKLDIFMRNAGYREKFDKLMEGKFKSDAYLLSDTCNTLYWGLMNEKLTEEEFLNHYHFLMFNLFFFREQCKGKLPAGEYSLAKSVREITLHELDSGSDYSKDTVLMRSLLQNASDQRHQYKIFEFFLTDNVKSLLAAHHPRYFMRNKRSNEFQQNHHLFWIGLFELHVPGVWLSEDKTKIAIGSFSLLSLAVETGTLNPVKIKPGFGAGDWDALKLMRLEEQHPVALWHPEVSNSLEQPDGYWAGTLSHMHDFYHLRLINKLGKEKRQWYLGLDTKISCRRIAFYKRVLSDKKTELDKIFIHIFGMLKYGGGSNVEGWDTKCISELLQLEVNQRSFVDQELHKDKDKDEDIPPRLHTILYGGRHILYDLNFQEKLETNLFIFHVIMSDDARLANALLGINIREYPEVRDAITKYNETSDNADKEIKDYLDAHPSAGFKWLMDKWIMELSQCK